MGTPPPASKEIEVPKYQVRLWMISIITSFVKEFVKSNFLFNQMINIFVGVTFLYDSFNIKAQKIQNQHIPGSARYKSVRKGWNTKKER